MCLIFKRRHLETGLDGLDTARGVAGHALQEEQPRLLVQDRVRGSASDHLDEMMAIFQTLPMGSFFEEKFLLI